MKKPTSVITDAIIAKGKLRVWQLLHDADQKAVAPGIELAETLTPLLFQHMLFIPGLVDPTDAAGIIAALKSEPRLKPLLIAFTKGGLLTLTPKVEAGDTTFHLLMHVPVRSVALASLQIQVLSRVEGKDEGLAIRLPADLVRLQGAYDAVLRGTKKGVSAKYGQYDWGHDTDAKTGFIPDYRKDLAEQMGRKMVGLRFTKIVGLQAQVNSDPRVGEDQVAISKDDELWFLDQLVGEGHKELASYYEKHGTIAGAQVFLLRYPAVDPNSGRWLTLIILTDKPGMKIYVNAVTWSEMQGGDEDGDLGYLGCGKERIRFYKVALPGPFPRIVVGPMPADLLQVMLDSWEAAQTGDPLTKALAKIQNMMVKDLTGLVTYTMHCIARAAGARGMCGSQNKTQALTTWMNDIYEMASLLTEGVMDTKKKDALIAGLYALAHGLMAGITGKELDADQFTVFLPEEYRPKLDRALSVINYKLDACRETGYGQVVACGRKLTTGGAAIIDRMLSAGHQPADCWRLLEEDGTGKRYLPLEMGERPEIDGSDVPAHLEDIVEGEKTKQKKGQRVVKFVREGKPTNLKEVFSSLRVIVSTTDKAGVTTNTPCGPCFKVVEPYKEELGTAKITVLFTPSWRKGFNNPLRLTLELPIPAEIPGGTTEHRLLKLDGVSTRIWQPGYVQAKDGSVLEMKVWGWLQTVLTLELESLTHRYTLNNAKKVEGGFQDGIVAAIRKLPVDDPHGNGDGLERMVRRREWEILVEDDDQVKVWQERLAILEVLAGQGYQMLCTSKNAPGTLVTKANSHGVPAYIAALNPLAKFGQMHRWCELREYRESLILMHPVMPSIQPTNAVPWPKWMTNKVGSLNVVLMNAEQLNRFIGKKGAQKGKWFNVDTLLCCPSMEEKTALKELLITCEDEEERDAVAESFERGGYSVVAYPGTPERIGNDLEKAPWIVKVLGPIVDHGKFKTLVGACKGVMNMLPYQLKDEHGVDIDLIICWDSVDRKAMWDLILWLYLQKVGVTEVDPAATMDDLLLQIWQALEDEDGLTGVTCEGEALGRFLTGAVPFYRPSQTARQTFRFKRGERGIKIQPHVMLMSGGIDWQTPARVYAEFTDLINTREKALSTFWTVIKGVPAPQAPETVYTDADAPEVVEEGIDPSIAPTVTVATSVRPHTPVSFQEIHEQNLGTVTPTVTSPSVSGELPLWKTELGTIDGFFWDAQKALWLVRVDGDTCCHEPVAVGIATALVARWEKELVACPKATGAEALRALVQESHAVLGDPDQGGGSTETVTPTVTSEPALDYDVLVAKLAAAQARLDALTKKGG